MSEHPEPDEAPPAPVAIAPRGYVVRHGLSRHLGEFSAEHAEAIPRGQDVIIRTDRGTEWGEVLCPATERTRDYLATTEPAGRILRLVTESDRDAMEKVRQSEKNAFASGGAIIAESRLAMRLVDVEWIFGGERLVFYYLAEKRIDFRQLVKSLARQFRSRIEMRQIGVRDEAKLLADYGDCGKPVCCNTHLREMPPVSMKMAKLQKATLDPNKISGRCGRLKCCLRYEYDTYEAHHRELPKQGNTVLTRHGQGRVIAVELLARKILVQYEDRRRALTDESEILSVVRGARPEAAEA